MLNAQQALLSLRPYLITWKPWVKVVATTNVGSHVLSYANTEQTDRLA